MLGVVLFGSAARKEQTVLSDVDLCLVMMPQPEPFEPATFLRKRLEYLKDFSLDLRIFQQLPLHVRRRVLKEGQVLSKWN